VRSRSKFILIYGNLFIPLFVGLVCGFAFTHAKAGPPREMYSAFLGGDFILLILGLSAIVRHWPRKQKPKGGSLDDRTAEEIAEIWRATNGSNN
jgi:hypothetical protein